MKRYEVHRPRTRRRRTAEEIATILQEHRQSGLSLLAFAHQHHLCYGTLLRWKRKLTKARPEAAAAATGPGFVPVQIEAESIHPDYVLSWPQGRSLSIPSGFDPQTLRRLLTVLEEQR